jgi:hypothetical protein
MMFSNACISSKKAINKVKEIAVMIEKQGQE